MSTEDKQAWLTDRWSNTMIPEGASENWKNAFLQQLKDSLPSEWSAEQTRTWAEFQEFLDDPAHRNQLQEIVRPFWQILEQRALEPGEWNTSMGALIERAIAASQASLSVDDPEVQRLSTSGSMCLQMLSGSLSMKRSCKGFRTMPNPSYVIRTGGCGTSWLDSIPRKWRRPFGLRN